jgi:hypothetical protein
MRLTVLFLGAAALLFLLSTVPKIQRSWMIGLGLALLAASFMPCFNRSIE